MGSFERLFRITLIAFSGAWLLHMPLAGHFLILLILLGILGLIQKENHFRLDKQLLLWGGLFGLYGLSLFWSSHPDASALERKLAFLAFPILLAFKWKNPLPLAQMWLSHIIACLILIGIAYYDAIQCQLHLGNSVRCFSTTYFSQVHHPTYFSAYLIFGIIGLLLQKVSWFDTKPRWLSWLVIALFSFMHMHLGTLAGILALGFLFMLYFSRKLSLRFGKIKSLGLGILAMALGLFGASLSSEIKADANNALNFTKQYIQNPTKFVEGRKEPLQGNEVRLILWTVSYELGNTHPFGMGLGGVEPHFTQQLKQWGYPLQAKKEFNPHNQYLQIWNEIGFIGLLIFLGILIGYIISSIQKRNLALLLLVLTFAIFCNFESMLQRESGIVFFLCWFCILSADRKIIKP